MSSAPFSHIAAGGEFWCERDTQAGGCARCLRQCVDCYASEATARLEADQLISQWRGEGELGP